MQRRSSKAAKGGKKLPTAYSKADAFGGSKYEVSHIVGKGAYGVVWAGRCRTKQNKKVAIKHIDRVFEVREDALRIVRELRFLRLLKHPNVVAVEDVLLPRNRKSYNDIHIVFELFDTDLNHMIRSETRYDMTHRRWVLYQILQGVAHMHSAEVFHRDLKPGNILINANCDCKICDFGMARARKPEGEEETVALWTDYVASRWYRAPELICCYLTRYTAAIDIWSIGCIASELLLRKALFPGKNGEQQLELITNLVGAPSREDLQSLRSSRVKELLRTMRGKSPTDFRSFFPVEADDLELALIKEMIVFSADKRILGMAAVEHQYFDEIRDLPGAQIPYTETPRLDKSEFVFEDARAMTKDVLREVLYKEIEHYHPDLRAEWEAARVEDETIEDGGEDGASSAGTEGDGTKCWRRRPRLDSKGNVRSRASGSGSDVEEVFEVEDDHQPEPEPEPEPVLEIAVPPTGGDFSAEDPV